MAIRDDFAPGEVLAAADLNDTFASKAPFQYGTVEPTTDVEGFIWFDENDTPATPKYWDGTEFVPFPSGVSALTVADVTGTTGTVITHTYTDDGIGYTAYEFQTSGSITLAADGFADVLIVGGGGGGGRRFGGGGGAGGHVFAEDVYLPAGELQVRVGAGGAGGVEVATSFPSGLNGNASAIGDYIVAPGGGGGGGTAKPGSNGGSAGGGGGNAGPTGTMLGGSGFAPQGNDGGAGNVGAAGRGGGGGGGGAGAVGSDSPPFTSGGDGGAGVANGITDPTAPVTRAGGGAGGARGEQGGTAGTGGAGGGGNGTNNNTTAGAGGTNLGGGGGAGGFASGDGGAGGAGGSGVIVVRVRT